MHEQPMAVLADIHGNRWALEAVLHDIERRRIDHIVHLGDCLYGPLDPAGTAEILMKRRVFGVRGNQDRQLTETSSPASPAVDQIRSSLGSAQMEWLGILPPIARLGASAQILLCHGTPSTDTEYLLRSVDSTGSGPRGLEELESLVSSGCRACSRPDPRPELILCAHDHVPGVALLDSGTLIVNPGAVGLQAYDDTEPSPHVMEAGSPHARYAVISWQDADPIVDQVQVPYDWHAAASVAAEAGRPDWARWLRTGRASAT